MSRKIAAALASAAVGAIALLMSLPATAAPTTVMGKVGTLRRAADLTRGGLADALRDHPLEATSPRPR